MKPKTHLTEPDRDKITSLRATVSAAMTAETVGRETGEAYPAVLATAVMITYMERACARAMLPMLEGGQMTVGVKFEIAHFNPTPVGAEFVAYCKFLHQEKALYWFEVWCEDGAGLVGKGRHARAVVDRAQIEATAGQRGTASIPQDPTALRPGGGR